ncbi:MAG: lipopolysaccharide kinase InaA family protein [Thermoanaerobaculia bacterium]
MDTETFDFGDLYGEVISPLELRGPALENQIRRLTDPAAATETIHWGRNYLYRATLESPAGRFEVVVKQFRNQGLRARLLRRWRGSKAERSFRVARDFQAAGLPTPSALLLVESARPDGPSFFVSRYLDGVVEVRYILRAANRGRERDEFPEIDLSTFLRASGKTLCRMHDSGFFHRDLSIGNLLVAATSSAGKGGIDLYLVDLNRARRQRRLSLSQRTRDLCRLALFVPEHRELFLAGYWGEGQVGWLRRACYLCYHHGFHFRITAKKKLRTVFGRLRDRVLPRHAHAHIPAADPSASVRDRIVWDALSDQPHQHASKAEKLAIRVADAPGHFLQTATFLAAAPRIWRRYRQLKNDLYRRPVPWQGAGICVGPSSLPDSGRPDRGGSDPRQLLEALADLGVSNVLLRLCPWNDDHDADEELAGELRRRGYELAFALPQNRDLVRDPERWRSKLEELAARFTPFGRHFQVGQAVNRSKWGVWRMRDYYRLASIASEILRGYPGVEILGPAVIDFEPHVTAAVLNRPGLNWRFDAVSSLLYVDRRGAPENRQLSFDTVDKVVLLQAIAETGRNCEPRSWITEVNWPLREGPHSPAGKGVSVDEATQADYLVRYFLLALTTGMAERVYWWQLVARGYGLIAPDASGQPGARRSGFHALATLERQLRGRQFIRPLETSSGIYLFLFRGEDGSECIAGWSLSGRQRTRLPRPAESVFEIDGSAGSSPVGSEVEVLPSVRYFHLNH